MTPTDDLRARHWNAIRALLTDYKNALAIIAKRNDGPVASRISNEAEEAIAALSALPAGGGKCSGYCCPACGRCYECHKQALECLTNPPPNAAPVSSIYRDQRVAEKVGAVADILRKKPDAAVGAQGDVSDLSERRALNKALDALDALSEAWAEEVNLTALCANLAKAADVPAAIRAMVVQAWVEGAYAGRTSHKAEADPKCRDCGTPLFYECIGCSATNYPPPESAAPAVGKGADASAADLMQEASEVLEAVGCSGVTLPDNWRWPLADELSGQAALTRWPVAGGGITDADWARTWRNRFIEERTGFHRLNGMDYESARANAEADAEGFMRGFVDAMKRRAPTDTPADGGEECTRNCDCVGACKLDRSRP